jgi:hypothetical protein
MVGVLGLAATLAPWALVAQSPAPSTGVKFAQVNPAEMKDLLTYLASDALQGRQAYTEGYGLAAAFVAERLRAWGVKPMGDEGTYFQTVRNRGYRVTRNSSVTVEVRGETRTFRHGDHVTFPLNAGGKQTLTFDGIEFVGYGLVALPSAASGNVAWDDFRGRDVRSRAIMLLPGSPAILTQGGRGARGGGNRATFAVQSQGAAAVFQFSPAPPPPTAADVALVKAQEALVAAQQALAEAQAQVRGGTTGRAGGRGAAPAGRGGAAAVAPDITTVQRLDAPVAPQITADETFYEFLVGADQFTRWRAAAEKGDTLAPTRIAARVTITIDHTYDVVSTQLTKNVVGLVEGADPKLRDTYVMFGAHLDHVGYRPSPPAAGRGAGQPGAEPDLIFNGADDDGSGSVGLMGIAKAFATGPKPRRSTIFVWHTAEESGLLGSRYMADFPVVPLEKVQAQFNIDMIGRNRDDNPGQSNTVYVIGADRISTDLHNLVVDTNATLARPITLDYEYNDPSDPNSFYTRSDHYSYAAKGIPIAFFFTGTHPDYHGAGDHADKILYPKLSAIAQLVYQAGFNVANTDRTLARDNKGPRAGRGFAGRIER